MRGLVVIFVSGCVMCSAFLSHAVDFDTSGYDEVEGKVLKLKPEDYRNKKIFYEGRYGNTMTAFPPYAERSGIKAGKHYWLVVEPTNLPVIARKGKDFDELVAQLKSNNLLKLYGRVKKFNYKPERTTLPQYYFEVEYFEVLGDAPDRDEVREKWREKRREEREKNRQVPPPLPPE